MRQIGLILEKILGPFFFWYFFLSLKPRLNEDIGVILENLEQGRTRFVDRTQKEMFSYYYRNRHRTILAINPLMILLGYHPIRVGHMLADYIQDYMSPFSPSRFALKRYLIRFYSELSKNLEQGSSSVKEVDGILNRIKES